MAKIYGIETKRINEAVKNNPECFPDGYIIQVSKEELDDLRSKFSTTKFSMTRTEPKAFTKKGLYMLATILKSKKTTKAKISIIETFAKLKNLARVMKKTIRDEK